uniref:Chromosome 11 open reading frame 68 n=1 Tax=Leptobrachium leishanense TaxID=445787 RepID=A0A8C5MXS2_9ANUR
MTTEPAIQSAAMAECEEGEPSRWSVSDDLAAASMAADMDPWIIFDARKTPRAEFDEWLETYRPSRVHRFGNPCEESGPVGWIAVYGPSYCPGAKGGKELHNAWDKLQSTGRNINFEAIRELALNFGVTSGKWLMHLDTGFKVDHAWRCIATAVVDGRLNVAKVSPFQSDNNHVICVYTWDFTDEESIMQTDAVIRSSGVKCVLTYKPDIYTYLGIYRSNQWKICPTIYESRYDLECVPRRSRVINKVTSLEVT